MLAAVGVREMAAVVESEHRVEAAAWVEGGC